MIYLRPFREHESETDRNDPFIPSGPSREDTSQSTGSLAETIEELNAVSESTAWDIYYQSQFNRFGFVFSPMVVISRPVFRHLPETRWIQNLRHASYQLRQPVPVLIEKSGDAVTASYEDVELCGTGESVKAAISALCTNIVAHYEALQANGRQSQDYTFLKQIIEEIQSPAWEEVKQLYREKLEEIPYVRKGYIKINGNDGDIFIILSEESVEQIKHLAGIDLELNLKFRPLYFFVEYRRSEEYIDLDDFERFY